MLNLPKFVHCINKTALTGQHGFGFILETMPPYVVGCIRCCKSDQDFLEVITTQKLLAYTKVPGYNICIYADRTLSGRVQATPALIDALQRTVGEMALFFYEVVIADKPKAYRPFKYSVTG